MPYSRRAETGRRPCGKNGGRACWVVAATLCGGKEQGGFGQKYKSCAKCDFYLQVRTEEGSRFKYSSVLQAQLKP